MTELHPALRIRPGMYLASIDGHFNFGSMCYNALGAVTCSPDAVYSGHLDITAAGPYFTVTVTGLGIVRQDEDMNKISKVFDVDTFPNGRELAPPGFGFLAPIVWFSESCAVDVNNGVETYREMFLNGRPVGGSLI